MEVRYNGRNFYRIVSEQAALVRRNRVYGGVLMYNEDGVPCLRGFDVSNITGPSQFVLLRKGDRLTLLK